MRAPLRLLSCSLLASAVAACADVPPAPPPPVEFLVSAGDSTYWVRPTEQGLRLRGSPILIAHFDGRFHEVYVTDDDRSYEDAVFVGQRLWRRDLVRGDSVLVFEDTLVPRLARRWAAEHPEARLLESNEPESGEPVAATSAEVSVIAIHGPYLSYEYHADVEDEQSRPWHTTRRGVVDLRSGRTVTVADLFGREAADRATTRARRRYLETLDSLVRSGDERARRIAGSLDDFEFDPTSFSVNGDAAAPSVEFFAPGAGEGESGDFAIPAGAVEMPAPRWWAAVRQTLPVTSLEEPEDQWDHGPYQLSASYRGDRARLSLHGPEDRTWSVGSVQAPVHHVLWLDAAVVDSLTRRGLRRAFDEAVFYDEMTRTAAFDGAAPLRRRCIAGRTFPDKPRA